MQTPNNFLRVLQIHDRLKRGLRVSGPTLAVTFELSERQVYRLIEFLRDRFRAPLAYDRGKRTYYYTEPTFELPSAILTEEETISLLTAHNLLQGMQPMPLSAELSEAVRKLQTFLPDTVSADLSPWTACISCRPSPAALVAAPVLDKVARGLAWRRTVRIQYYSAYNNATTARSVDLYHLALRSNDWYAIGFCHLRQDVRKFLIHRIRSAIMEDRTYAIPPEFNVEEYLRDALSIETSLPAREVVLEFDAYEARWIRERVWHDDQVLERLQNGGIRMTVNVSQGVELQNWILSFGEHVRVLAPDDLQDVIESRLDTALRNYRCAKAQG